MKILKTRKLGVNYRKFLVKNFDQKPRKIPKKFPQILRKPTKF